MKLKEQDRQILKDLCDQHNVSYDKVLKLIQIEKDYQQKGTRLGIYEALRDIIKPN